MTPPRELAGLLAGAERAVFHGAPGTAVGPLEQAVALASVQQRTAEWAAATWLLGVAFGASGRYGAALTVLPPLVEGAPTLGAERKLFGSLAAATLGSVERQLGRHAQGREWDERGLVLAGGTAEAAFDCQLGLAADAVGLGQTEVAADRLAAAADVAAGRDGSWWRQQVRLAWVGAECALLTDRPGVAVGHAQDAVRRAERAEAPRHVAKGLLFLGVARHEAGVGGAADVLRRSATLAESLGALPLVWPARAVLGALLADIDPAESSRCLTAARAAVTRIARELPDAYREEWLARPEITALLSAG